MSMAPTTEPQTSDTDLGHRLFVLGVFAAFFVEVAITVSNIGRGASWTSILIGVCFSLMILLLGNWLYSGDRTALKAMRLFIAIQLLFAVGAIIVFWGDEGLFEAAGGIHALWQAVLKLFVYLGFAGLLFFPGVTLDFLSIQRGETPTTALAAQQSTPTGSPVDLTADHVKVLDGLQGAVRLAASALLVVGLLELLLGIRTLGDSISLIEQTPDNVSAAPLLRNSGLFSIIEGLAVAALGMSLGGPARALQSLLGSVPRTTGLVANLFVNLLGTFKAFAVILLLLAALVIGRLILNL